MTEPVRPPESGPGSGVAAWREYAAAVTGSDIDAWSSLSRDEIIELLDEDEAQSPAAEQEPDYTAVADPPAVTGRHRRPQWIKPDGTVE